MYIARGEPFGGSQALEPLANKLSDLVTNEILAYKGEFLFYTNKSSALVAIDYIFHLRTMFSFLPVVETWPNYAGDNHTT